MRSGYIWDDDWYVTRNFSLRSGGGLIDLWTRPGVVPQYYPVTHTSFWIEYCLWGLRPAGYHAVNILLHASSAVLLWLILRRLGVPVTPAEAARSCAYRRGPRRSARQYQALSPPGGECAFCPFDVLSGRFAVLFNEIPQQCPKRLAPFVFRQHMGNVTRHRLGPPSSNFAVDSHQLILGQTDGNLRPGHTRTIPLVKGAFEVSRCHRVRIGD